MIGQARRCKARTQSRSRITLPHITNVPTLHARLFSPGRGVPNVAGACSEAKPPEYHPEENCAPEGRPKGHSPEKFLAIYNYPPPYYTSNSLAVKIHQPLTGIPGSLEAAKQLKTAKKSTNTRLSTVGCAGLVVSAENLALAGCGSFATTEGRKPQWPSGAEPEQQKPRRARKEPRENGESSRRAGFRLQALEQRPKVGLPHQSLQCRNS